MVHLLLAVLKKFGVSLRELVRREGIRLESVRDINYMRINDD